MRQLHLWLGAWGALAAIAYGATGLVLNHRFGGGLPQGSSRELGVEQVAVPATARARIEDLRAWLEARGAQVQVQREQAASATQPLRWVLGGGTARESFLLEYLPGNATAQQRRSAHSPLAAALRLHKGVGGGLAWIVFADSIALGLVALGLSGLVLWSRGRTPAQWLRSLVGLSLLAFAGVLWLAAA